MPVIHVKHSEQCLVLNKYLLLVLLILSLLNHWNVRMCHSWAFNFLQEKKFTLSVSKLSTMYKNRYLHLHCKSLKTKIWTVNASGGRNSFFISFMLPKCFLLMRKKTICFIILGNGGAESVCGSSYRDLVEQKCSDIPSPTSRKFCIAPPWSRLPCPACGSFSWLLLTNICQHGSIFLCLMCWFTSN